MEFFAKSHGKGPQDGVGGTMKQIAARKSLQSPINEQILHLEQLLKWLDENVHGIKYIHV